jgi:hypothetical protein
MNQFTNELEAFVSPVSSLMKTDFCSGIPVMVFNPVEAQRRGAVTVRLEDLQSAYVRVYDEKGRLKAKPLPFLTVRLNLCLLQMLKASAQGFMTFV